MSEVNRHRQTRRLEAKGELALVSGTGSGLTVCGNTELLFGAQTQTLVEEIFDAHQSSDPECRAGSFERSGIDRL